MGWWVMSSDTIWLAIKLDGPFQSWGYDSQYNRRNTGLFPTKSAMAGICCAALGYSRGSEKEREFLGFFRNIKMTAIAIPRVVNKKELVLRRLEDYHTVQNTRTAKGDIKDCHITRRQYLTDSSFGVLLEGEAEIIKKISNALKNPHWGVWLGRKACIPTAPILAGINENKEETVKLLIGDKPLRSFAIQEEASEFSAGDDSLPDSPDSFAIERRLFSPRRVKTKQGSG